MHQKLWRDGPVNQETSIKICNVSLKEVPTFVYMGSTLWNGAMLDHMIATRIRKTCSSFGHLYDKVWKDHGLTISTKVRVYEAVVLTVLLYGSETWILYRKHVNMLESFHMRHLRIILDIRWQDNIEAINRANSTSLEALLIKAHMAWHKNCVLKKGVTQMVGSCSMDGWHTAAKNCSLWRVVLDRSVVIASDTRTPWRFCGSCIGLFSHLRAHNKKRLNPDWAVIVDATQHLEKNLNGQCSCGDFI